MLQLKRMKYCKQQKGCNNGFFYKGSCIDFGFFGLKMMDVFCIINCQIEVVCIVMICYMKCEGKVWICIFLDKLIIVKLQEVCMGKGKGVFDYWVVEVKFG